MPRRKDKHVGGFQAPLFPPASDWVPPRRLTPPRPGLIAIDLEVRDDGIAAGLGPGWAMGMGHPVGVAMAQDDWAQYAPLRHPETENLSQDRVRDWVGAAYRLAAAGDARLVFHNAAYDLGWVEADLGLAPPRGDCVDDTMLAAFHADENAPSFALDALCVQRGLPGKDEALLREAAAAYCVDPKAEMWRLPARYVGAYAEADVRATLALLGALAPILDAEGTRGAYAVDAELIACCVEMRRRGVPVNSLAVERGREGLTAKTAEALAELSRRAGRRVTIEDVRSPQRMEAMMTQEGVEFPRTGGTGQASLAAEWMQKSDHWLPTLAERAVRLTNAADKFMGGYLLNFAHRGRIHPTINLFLNEDEGGVRTGTRSHRFSYSAPPLQQAPGDKMAGVDAYGAEVVRVFRSCLEPEPGEVWLSPDYSQQEFRMLVHFASLLGLPKADEACARYRDDPRTDYHDMVMSMIGFDAKFGPEYGRRRTKDVNFAVAFGAGLGKFMGMTGMTEVEAVDVLGTYDAELPFPKALGKVCQDLAQQRGYVRLLGGARIHYTLWEPAGWLQGGQLREVSDAAKAAGAAGAPVRWHKGRPRVWGREGAGAVWPGMRLCRADTQKGRNNLVQGSSARQTKIGMLTMWREGIVPMIQMHDEIPTSVADEATGRRVAEVMRTAAPIVVPTVVDSEYGSNWGAAKAVKRRAADGSKVVLYGATYEEARRLQREGPWW